MIYQATSSGSETNCYLLEEEGYAIIIDPGAGKEISEIIKEHDMKPEYIFLTHEHFDHIWDLEEIRDMYDIPVVACRLCSDGVQDKGSNLSSIADLLSYFKTGVVPETKSKVFTCRGADIVFDDTFNLEWRGHSFDFQRLPGHSPGSVIIIMDDSLVFTGDYLIYGEEEITRLKGGSTEDYNSIARPVLEAIPQGRKIYPGHGIVYRKGMEQEHGLGNLHE